MIKHCVPWKNPKTKECPACGTTRGLVREARALDRRCKDLKVELEQMINEHRRLRKQHQANLREFKKMGGDNEE